MSRGAARDLFGLVGTVIAGKFRVDRPLAEGGHGVVYAGTHLVVAADVAIKCLKPAGFTPDDRARGIEAFLREGRILFGLTHPAIVRLYDVGVVGETPYAVLELLRGTTLADEIAERARQNRHFTKEELAATFGPILEAIAFAHERGVVHRDIKPANMMLVADASRVTPKVLDFGTALAAHADPLTTAAAVGAGFTPLYAAPEQWDAAIGVTSAPTDVFALGMVLAEACLLRYPFDGKSGVYAIMRAALDEGSRPAIAAERPDLPPDLGRVIERALRVQPGERYPDGRELLASFRAALKISPNTAPLVRPLAISAPPALSNRLPWAIGFAGLLVAILALAIGAGVVFRARRGPGASVVDVNDPSVASAEATGPVSSAVRVSVLDVSGAKPFFVDADLLAVADRHRAALLGCADRAALGDEPGDLLVTVRVGADRRADLAQCTGRDENSPPGACECVVKSVKAWTFPPWKTDAGAPPAFVYTLRMARRSLAIAP